MDISRLIRAIVAIDREELETAEDALSDLSPEELVRIAAIAGQVQDIAMSLAQPVGPDGIPSAAVLHARHDHERAVPQVYGLPVVTTQPVQPRIFSFDADEGI